MPGTVLLTGPPGVGKTSLIKKIFEELRTKQGVECQGFYTEEIRKENGRIGFDIVSLNGKREVLARDSQIDQVRRPKVGKYYVYISNLEKVALPLLRCENSQQQPIIIDEIGKMELLSKPFEEAVNNIIDQCLLISKIPFRTRHPLEIVERLRSSTRSTIFEISKQNRNDLLPKIIEKIMEFLNK